MVMQPDYICEEQQKPQQLELDNVYEHYSEASSSTIGMHPDLIGEEMHQTHPLDIDEGYESYFRQSMHIDQPQHSNASYDPILTHISSTNFYFEYQLEQADSSEEMFPTLWSW